MSTIGSLIGHGIILGTVTTSGTYASPLTITATGMIVASTGRGVYASGGYSDLTLVNQGTITAAADYAVDMSNGGYVDNFGTASLIQGRRGVVIYSNAGSITNSGRIVGTGAAIYDAGVRLNVGGSVGNTGHITGFAGVYLEAAGSVTNSGTITGNGAGVSKNAAVDFQQGGIVNSTGGVLQGYRGVEVYGAAGTITNAGTIEATGTGISSDGIYLHAGGRVDNNGGLITGYYEAITGGTYVSNSGTITSTVTNAGWTVVLSPGGTVVNNANGLIKGGHAGIGIFAGAGTVTNNGQIIGTYGNGVAIYANGSIGNTGTGALIRSLYDGVYMAAGTVGNSGTIAGTGSAGIGVRIGGGGTVVDSGTISGGGGTAVLFGGGAGNLLGLETGYALSGRVFGAASAANTVELLGAGGAVTVGYNSLSLINFATVAFGAASGNSETLRITNAATLPGTIAGFVSSFDTIDLNGFAGGTVLNGGSVNGLDQLVVSNGGGTVTLQLDPSENYSTVTWTAVSDGSVGTDLTPVCYCRGTRILTPKGEVAVEDFGIGDEVVTLSGAARPVKWIGRRAYDGRFVAGNRAVLPVRIAADALADGVPARDLRVSPGHALYIDGVLVRAEHLVNGATIVQESAADLIEYFHVELETHDILVADGAPAESYADCDNRARFHNAAEFASLYPDDGRPHWQYCAPLLEWGSDEPNAIRATLLERAQALGHTLDLDADLHLVVDGATIRPAAVADRVWRFTIPAGSAVVLLASRSIAPAEVEAHSRDRRRLGVPVERLVLYDGDLRLAAGHGHPGLAAGFHDGEATHRWTDGVAALPDAWLRAFPAAFTLEVQLYPSGLRYRLPPPAAAAEAA